jgi:hypothetical protein
MGFELESHLLVRAINKDEDNLRPSDVRLKGIKSFEVSYFPRACNNVAADLFDDFGAN